MGMFVKFWGTRGSIPTPGYATQIYGGNTACVEIRVDEALFICDAGSGIRELGMDLLKRNKGPIMGHLLLSHTHWDHIQGFPFFVPVYNPANTFLIVGTPHGGKRFFNLLSGQMTSEYFPVDFKDLGARILSAYLTDERAEIEGVKITCLDLIHPGGSYAYAFEKDGRKVVYATDNELDLEIENKEEIEGDATLMRVIPDRFINFCRGADLLIADGQYTDTEYNGKVGWGHARDSTVVDFAIQAEVKQLAITHHDPLDTDEKIERKIAHCRARVAEFGVDLTVFAAREGVELKI